MVGMFHEARNFSLIFLKQKLFSIFHAYQQAIAYTCIIIAHELKFVFEVRRTKLWSQETNLLYRIIVTIIGYTNHMKH